MGASDWWARRGKLANRRARERTLENFSLASASSRGVVLRFAHFSPYRSEFSNLLKIASLPLIKAFQRQSISTAPGSHSTQTRICEMIYECLVWEV